MDTKVEKQVADLIGENLDRLISIDWRCQGMIHPLYEASREKSDGPLTMGAARKFVERIKEDDVVFILTGFLVGPFDVLKDGKFVQEHGFSNDMLVPETDGIVAAALIARAVDLGFKAKPVIFCEEECQEATRASCVAAGLRVYEDFETSLMIPHAVTLRTFTKNAAQAKDEAEKILDVLNPQAAVSIERPGRNEKGWVDGVASPSELETWETSWAWAL